MADRTIHEIWILFLDNGLLVSEKRGEKFGTDRLRYKIVDRHLSLKLYDKSIAVFVFTWHTGEAIMW